MDKTPKDMDGPDISASCGNRRVFYDQIPPNREYAERGLFYGSIFALLNNHSD